MLSQRFFVSFQCLVVKHLLRNTAAPSVSESLALANMFPNPNPNPNPKPDPDPTQPDSGEPLEMLMSESDSSVMGK